jgi:hypothetical protein
MSTSTQAFAQYTGGPGANVESNRHLRRHGTSTLAASIEFPVRAEPKRSRCLMATWRTSERRQEYRQPVDRTTVSEALLSVAPPTNEWDHGTLREAHARRA